MVNHRRGQATLEFTLAALALFLLLGAIAEFGRAVYTYDLVQYSARIGTRYAMTRGSGCVTYATPAPGPACTAYASAAPPSPAPYVTPIATYVRSKAAGINSSQLTVTTTWSSNGSCTASVSTTPAGSGCIVNVAVSYPFRSVFPFTFPVTISGSSQVIVTQ